MSQYKGNKTGGAFNPTYTPSGENSTPLSVVSTSMEIDGQMVEGYQATYENGTSKWTPHVLTDTPIFDSQNTDRSTFTGTIQEDGTWKWEPTTDTSIRTLARNYKGPNNEKITEGEIEKNFYSRKSPTIQQQFQQTQTKQLQGEYGEDLSTVKDGKFANGPLSQTAGNQTQTSPDGAVETSETAAGANIFDSDEETKKVRKEYGNYYCPLGIAANKQDRIIFKMRQSTGQVINPTDTTSNIGSRQRKTGKIEGSVTLPITTGIKDLNSVSWQGSKMNPLQAFAAAGALGIFKAARECLKIYKRVG